MMKLLLIGDEIKSRRLKAAGFEPEQYQVAIASTVTDLERVLRTESFQAAVLDFQITSENNLAMLRAVHAQAADLPVVVVCTVKDEAVVRESRDLGVKACLLKPYSILDLHMALSANALARVEEAPVKPSPEPEKAPAAAEPVSEITSEDPLMRRTLDVAVRAASTKATVLILGESGTGKTALARLIHKHSALHDKAFVTVNCPCLGRELLESELFGHVKGSFTGAVQDTWGKVAAADGGTLFLDEVGELPIELQPKLLRLLQEREYERVGETKARHANVRVIAATNRDLKAAVAAGTFREDLYYRLNVISMEVPPLRQRAMDVMSAAQQFMTEISAQTGKRILGFTTAATHALQEYGWPGNLRELRNLIERAVLMCDNDRLDVSDFPELSKMQQTACPQAGEQVSLRYLEEAHIREVVARSPSLEHAARILGIDKSTLYRKRKRMHQQLSEFPLAYSPDEQLAEVAS